MNWFKYLLNDKPLSLYYEESPSLNNVRLMELKINEDGPILIARIELNDFPGNPPDKWEAECNKVQIMLEFIEINQLCISGWDTDNIVDINFEKKGSNPLGVQIRLKQKGEEKGLLANLVWVKRQKNGTMQYGFEFTDEEE